MARAHFPASCHARNLLPEEHISGVVPEGFYVHTVIGFLRTYWITFATIDGLTDRTSGLAIEFASDRRANPRRRSNTENLCLPSTHLREIRAYRQPAPYVSGWRNRAPAPAKSFLISIPSDLCTG